MHRGRRTIGLSLFELLLAVLILVVLSSLLFPVLSSDMARARQAVCLGNVRTVALAVRMYLDDNDGYFPPLEADPSVLSYFDSCPGGSVDREWDPSQPEDHCERGKMANPYLRYPVLLDEYVLSRDVWRCPNAFLESGASFVYGTPDWLGYLKAHEGEWGAKSAPYLCPEAGWPAGWGGELSDSIAQGRMAVPRGGKGRKASPGAFVQSIGTTTEGSHLLRETSVEDPAWFVVCADTGGVGHNVSAGTLAYPDLCRLECAGMTPGFGDAEQCPWTQECAATVEMMHDPAARRPHARHFGGVNIGFLDGHAAWFDSEEVIRLSPRYADLTWGKLRGYARWAPTGDVLVAGR